MELRIKQLREDRNWTQAYVAECINLTKAAYANIENGRRRPSHDVLLRIENLFKENHRELFESVSKRDLGIA